MIMTRFFKITALETDRWIERYAEYFVVVVRKTLFVNFRIFFHFSKTCMFENSIEFF